MNKSIQTIHLLPNSSRKIALGIFILLTLSGLALAISSNFDKEAGEIAKVGLFIAFFIFALSKDKEEDELTLQLRLKSYASAFIIGLVTVIIDPMMNWIFEGQFISDVTANYVVLQMIIFYFLAHFVLNRPED